MVTPAVTPALTAAAPAAAMAAVASAARPLETLGLDPGDAGAMRRLLGGPSGLVLLVGPPGAGLRTSARALVQQLQRGEGAPFAGRVRSLQLEGRLRLQRALRAAERGDWVIGRVRHDRACAVPALLRSWGADRVRLAEALVLIASQRLVAGLCQGCCEADGSDETRRALAAAASTWLCGRPVQPRRRAPSGCAVCRGSGLARPILLYEWIEVDLRARSLLASGLEGTDLENALLPGGGTLWDHGLRLLAAGRIDLEALRRAIREPR